MKGYTSLKSAVLKGKIRTRFLFAAIGSFLFLFSACEKDINIKLNASVSNLVVDASIENDRPPIVILTQSLEYFNTISKQALASSFVRNAKVTIEDGDRKVELVQDSIPNVQGYTLYYYTSPITSGFVGQLKKNYKLTIEANGKIYQATTTIPAITKKIDSLYWEPLPMAKDSLKARLVIRATDPKGLGDYIRYWTKVNSEPFLPGLNSVYEDDIIDGTTYTLPIDKGVDRNVQFSDSSLLFKRGDTIVMKLCNIDRVTYDFWRTYEFSFQSIGNPFSSPTKILTNLNNGGVGYFGGYGCQYRTVIIPK